MAKRKEAKELKNQVGSDSKKIELEPLMKFKEMPFDKATEMLKKAGFEVTEEETVEIMEFLHTLAKLTIKEFFSPD